MGLREGTQNIRLERGLGLAGCLYLAVPLMIMGKGLVLALWLDWIWLGVTLVVLSAIVFAGLVRRFREWNVHFIDVLVAERVVLLGETEAGRETITARIEFKDLEGVGRLKAGTHGACYALVGKVDPARDLGRALDAHRNPDGFVNLTWWTQEYAGTIDKLLGPLVDSGVPRLELDIS